MTKRTNANTKRTYSSKVNIMVKWLREHYPALVSERGEVQQIPLLKDAVLAFFGYLSEPAHACDVKNVHADDAPSPPLSVSCVEGYRSALVDLYRSNTLEIQPNIDAELRLTLDGYDKTINDLNAVGS